MKLHAVACFLLLSGAAKADLLYGFQSPSGNIHCLAYEGAEGGEIRCDALKLTPSYPKRPADCDLDWGHAFAVATTGKAYLACVGDTVADPNNEVLPYGEALTFGGISCVSAKTGMTCTNAEGRGFSLAKARQELF